MGRPSPARRSRGWIVGPEGILYPPEPWRLSGLLHASLWRMPLTELPVALPAGAEAIRFKGHAFLFTFWGRYGGVLSYDEMICAVAVWAKRGPALTVTHIWVDDPSSAVGGRALWSVPKELGTFETQAEEVFTARLSARGVPIAAFRFVPRLSLPFRWRLPVRIAQRHDGGLNVTRAQARATLRVGRGHWRFDEAGPLHFLAGRRPLLSLRLDRMSMRFGT